MRRLSLEEELEETRARYRQMVEEAPEAITVFGLAEGHFVEVNASACRLFEATRDQLLETGPVEMSPPTQPDGRPSRDAARELIARAMEGGHPTFEWTHRTANGRPVLCRIQLARVPSPSAGQELVRASIIDITESVESERMRLLLREILDQTTDLVGMATPGGRVIWLNPAGRALCGLGRDDELGVPVAELHPPETREAHRRALEAAMRDGVWRGEGKLLSRDGKVTPVSQVILTHKNAAGEVEYISTIARDITERRAAEDLERKVQHAQKLESLGVLAGGIAHDFNNILVGLIGNASMLARKLTGTDAGALAGQLLEAGERASELAQQMLAYTGHAQVAMGEVVLADLIHDVSRLVAASVSKKARLHFDFDEDLPGVRGNRAQLQQVAMNLIINASDALGSEGGEITIGTGRVTPDRSLLQYDYLGPGADGLECVYLEVADTGAGMDPELVDRIFDPFFTTKLVGRGLGLAAVLGIVRGHGGAIRVTTAPGEGTRFCVVLPPWRCHEQPEAARVVTSAEPRGGTVLIVDDEPMVRQVVSMTLHELGYETLEAFDGPGGLELFEANADHIDLVLLDMTMPGLAGDEVLRRMREIRAGVPVVLTSGYASASTHQADAFLAKPFTLDQLEHLVVTLTRR